MTWPNAPNDAQLRWRRACRGLAALAFTLLVGVSIVAYLGKLPPWLPTVDGIDKIGHFLMYGGVAFFAEGAFAYRPLRRAYGWPRLAPVLLWVPSAIDEWAQRFSPHRSSELRDLLADTLGILLAGWLSAAIDRRLGRSKA